MERDLETLDINMDPPPPLLTGSHLTPTLSNVAPCSTGMGDHPELPGAVNVIQMTMYRCIRVSVLYNGHIK